MFSLTVRNAISLVPQPKLDLRSKDQLLVNLVFMYHTMKASEKLLEVGASMAKDRPDLAYYAFHVEEERDHHIWLASDLRTEGVNVENCALPDLAVEMVGSQYYLMYHVDPAALLGYLAVIEGSAPSEDAINHLEALHGTELLATMRYHAEHDVGHSEDLNSVLNHLRPESQNIVLQSAIKTARYMAKAGEIFKVTHG